MAKKSERGFGAVMAIVILVILAGLAAALTRIGTSSQLTSTQDVLAARASAAARAGSEWGMYQAIKGTWTTPATCNGAVTQLDLTSDTGFSVRVSCAVTTYNEGEETPGTPITRKTFTITATACNVPPCPNDPAAKNVGYTERKRQVVVTD